LNTTYNIISVTPLTKETLNKYKNDMEAQVRMNMMKDYVRKIYGDIIRHAMYGYTTYTFVLYNQPYLQDKKYTIHTSMKEIDSKLGNKLFIRIHRSFIVRLDVIESIELSNLRIENTSHILPIGGSYKEELFSKINTI
jgi:translation elongation factor EF-Ts